ncbi:hypothetical protein F5X98DRAFT_390059 [Xylaria grammica]|nr:hypothetical protein F5X98DRAFT_390059 [Xylaria grammica]
MAWLRRTIHSAPKDASTRESIPPSSHDPPPRHRQTPGQPEVDLRKQQPASSTPGSGEASSAKNGLRSGTTGTPRDAGVGGSSANVVRNNWKGQGVEQISDQQGRDFGEADANGEGRSRSIWERTAAGGRGSAVGDRVLLPSWLRDP